MEGKRGSGLRLIPVLLCTLTVTIVAFADIYQWNDGDGDGSIWLSHSNVEPYADLSGQVLWWADLNGAFLHHANLQEANLMYAQLVGANFGGSNLYLVNLYGADLSLANLSFANLSGANMTNTSIGGAYLLNTDLTNADLSGMTEWDEALWLGATYTNETVFPTGMDPDSFGMIEIPAPSAIVLVVLSIFAAHQRRRTQAYSI